MPAPNLVFEQVPVRLQLSIISNPPVAPVDRNTGNAPRIWRGNTVALDVGIFDSSDVAVDLTNLAYLQVILLRSQGDAVPLVVKQIDAVDITKIITIGAWRDGSAQQARASFTASDTDQGLDGDDERDFWLLIQGMTTLGAPIVYGAGPITIEEPGTVNPATPPKYVSLHKQATNTGDCTVTPASQIHTEVVTVGGIARTSNILLGINGVVDGARLNLVVNLPATAGITMNVRNSIAGNPVISSITTGSVLQALLEYYFDAGLAAWVPLFYALPPT